jgi:transposase
VEGLSKRDIVRCLKRYVIREVFHLIHPAENALLKTS